ncbi:MULTISPECIES: SDR family oxidoreductase [unclassified Leptolyngbya]|uniref:SDR family oxidoreductase n=1 Tax=unclassified Leptolyngbya TaxID=2650499 RepID=UPI0016887F72|nr:MULTISPECIES: SDR family oxidoreductase [unclassified Leptolyngbya]MBD1910882.1 SDR family oxidoreductase [Leptolyngbya sp. FACHB-8]MBD2153723.1 SDR family oxidoreductase [Leptolyngbya sp. FACHB-16]
MSPVDRIAVVTGANRGIGLETARQLAQHGIHVILTSRDQDNGIAAAKTLQSAGLPVTPQVLDVANPASIQSLVDFLTAEFGGVDILVNNAGVYLDNGLTGLNVPTEIVRQTLEINTLAPLQLSQAVIPLMRQRDRGRIVNVSSGMGALTDMTGSSLAYRVSKTALNAITRILADELSDTNILVNSVCPGWVKTAMGGESAPRSVEKGADTIVWLAMLPDGAPSGLFWRDREPIAW